MSPTKVLDECGPSNQHGLPNVEERPALGALAERWDALVAGGRRPTMFLASWWLGAVAPPGRSRFVLCFDDDQLVGGLALQLRRRRGVQVIELLGTGRLAPDHLDAVAAPEAEHRVVEALRRWIDDQAPCELDLRGLADGALLVSALPAARLMTSVTSAPYLPFAGGGSPAPRSQRHNLRRHTKRLAAMGAEHRTVLGDDPAVGEALERLRRMHRVHWGPDSGFAEGFPSVVAAVHGAGRAARVDELVVGDEVIAAELSFDVGGRRHRYQVGRSMDPRWSGAGSVLLERTIHAAHRDGADELDFLRGAEAYKYSWAPADRPVLRARAALGLEPRAWLAVSRIAERGRPLGRRVKAAGRRWAKRPVSPLRARSVAVDGQTGAGRAARR